MTDRPILFSAPMIRALLDGRKTQTRRLAWRHDLVLPNDPIPTIWQSVKLGDRLWVRETWAAHRNWDNVPPSKIEHPDYAGIWYATSPPRVTPYGKWRPSIHMPCWASRLTLVVTATKRERVQEISNDDAVAEGAFESGRIGDDPMHDRWTMTGEGWRWPVPWHAFQVYWQSLHTKPGARWEDNPEVVALTFTVHQCNIDRMEAAA